MHSGIQTLVLNHTILDENVELNVIRFAGDEAWDNPSVLVESTQRQLSSPFNFANHFHSSC